MAQVQCANCGNLAVSQGEQPWSTRVRMSRFMELSALSTSVAKSGCPTCKLIYEALQHEKPGWEISHAEQFIELKFAPGCPLYVDWRLEDIYLVLYQRTSQRIRPPTNLPLVIGKSQEVHEVSSDPGCFEVVHGWLQQCFNNHKACGGPGDTPLPTRVIDVTNDNPLLIETNGRPGKYIALSYCWGSNRSSLRTLRENIEAHLSQGMKFSELPKTIQHATEICRQLKVKYLWADALCIIQRDEEDWKLESPKLVDVYGNAMLTIGADNADSSDKGIFSNQKYGKRPHALSFQGYPIYARGRFEREHDYNALLMRMPATEVSNPDPINKRAWTLPEALMSHRMLHYTTEELVWECDEEQWCECGGSFKVEDDGVSGRILRDISWARALSREELYRKWDEIIVLFSERQHKDDEQRLVAISRLARRFSQVLEECLGRKPRYLAGIWEDNALRGLTWSVEDDYFRRIRDPNVEWRRADAKGHQPPTWSWASVIAPVTMLPMRHLEAMTRLLDASVTLEDSGDPFGMVCSGAITLRGPVRHGLTVQTKHAGPGDLYAGWTDGVQFRISTADASERSCPFICDDPSKTPEGSHGYSCIYLGRVRATAGDAESQYAEIDGWKYSYHAILVLKQVLEQSQEGSTSYERIGLSTRASWGEEHQKNIGALLAAATDESITLQ